MDKLLKFSEEDEGLVAISPVGEVKGKDGRAYNLDGEKLIGTLQANKQNLPLLVEHGQNSEYGEKAFGWFDVDSLVIKNGFLYAKLEKNKLGDELVSNKYYLYLSPAYLMDGDSRDVNSILHISLVNEPNLHLPELNKIKEKNHQLKVDLSIERGEIMPVERDFALALDEDSFNKFISLNKNRADSLKEALILDEKSLEDKFLLNSLKG